MRSGFCCLFVLLNGTLWMTVRTAVSAHDSSPVQVLTAHEEIATSEAATSCGFLSLLAHTAGCLILDTYFGGAKDDLLVLALQTQPASA